MGYLVVVREFIVDVKGEDTNRAVASSPNGAWIGRAGEEACHGSGDSGKLGRLLDSFNSMEVRMSNSVLNEAEYAVGERTCYVRVASSAARWPCSAARDSPVSTRAFAMGARCQCVCRLCTQSCTRRVYV